jgi:hypothetical protein
LKRYYAIRKAWINSTNTDQEKEYFDKLQIIEKEIKAYKASMEAKNPAANAMAQYVKFGIKEDKDA